MENLKCPFCGAELESERITRHGVHGLQTGMMSCSNVDCEYYRPYLPRRVWQALIDGKRAQDTVRRVKARLLETMEQDPAIYAGGFAGALYNEIETIKKKGGKICI